MEEKKLPTKKIMWGNFELTEWDNSYTYEGKQISSNSYKIDYRSFNKESGKTESLSHININKIYDLSIIRFLMERCKAGKITAILPINQYSIEREENGNYAIKQHYKNKEGVETFTALKLKFRHDILHLSDLLERSLAILMKPSKIGKSENSASNMPKDENEFVDETQDDDIPF